MLGTQSCPTLFNPMDCSPPGSSVHGILMARLLEWVAIPSSRDLLDGGIEPKSASLLLDSVWATRAALNLLKLVTNCDYNWESPQKRIHLFTIDSSQPDKGLNDLNDKLMMEQKSHLAMSLDFWFGWFSADY